MTSWDRRSPKAQAEAADAAIRAQFAHAVGPSSPYWRDRLAALGIDPAAVRSRAELARIPAVTERDVAPDGDPATLAALVLEPSGRWAAHADGPAVRAALVRRLVDRDAYRRAVAVDTRPTTFLSAGLGIDYLLACTRGDVDLMARAGARLLSVLGVGEEDVLLVALHPAATVAYRGLLLAALAAGVPALAPAPWQVRRNVGLLPVTVIAAESWRLADLLEDLAAGGADLSRVRLAVAVGAPSDEDRLAAEQALGDAGAAPDARVLAVHASSGARVLWGECPQAPADARGLHTYPDLEVVQLCDPDTGEDYAGQGPAEPVLTQLGFRGSALVRWRTGDVAAGALLEDPCPGCGRTVPRVPSDGLRAGALVAEVGGAALDLRSVTGLLCGRDDLADWALAVGRRARDGAGRVTVHLSVRGVPGVSGEPGDPGDVALEVAEQLRDTVGSPTQIVAVPPGEFTRPAGTPVTARIFGQ